MIELKEEKLNKLFRIASILAIFCCCILLLPQVRSLIINVAERVLGHDLNNPVWMKIMLTTSLYAILCFSIILTYSIQQIQNFLERNRKYIENIFVFSSILVIIMSILVRIIMYAKNRSLWLDEAVLAESIVTLNWSELFIPPLANGQSAPVLYVVSVKLLGLLLGYSEFSLRLFSLLSIIGLLVCEKIFLRKALGCYNFQIAFVVVMTMLLPSYIWYSNELKSYMSDAFFVILTILLYFYYTQNRVKLLTLTILYILILGISSPAIFFVAGILVFEFLSAILNKNKKQLFFVFISGTLVLAIFGLYYYWWLSPVSEGMKTYWDEYNKQYNILTRIKNIFNPGVGFSNSSFVVFFLPFALLGIFSLSKSGNKIARSVVLSLLFAFLASVMGYWPMTGRLWLFLPAIIIIFTPVGINFIHNKINNNKIYKKLEYLVFTIIIILSSLNCLGYIGDKMYFFCEEINPLIHYVQKNIKDDEKLYVYPSARYTFEFKNGYSSKKVGNVDNNNIIFGINRDEWNENSLGSELQLILEQRKVYLIFQHHFTGIDGGLEILRNYGTLTEVMNVYSTPLYFFERQ